MRITDVRVRQVDMASEDFLYRTPIKFGGTTLDRVTLLHVNMLVESADGKRTWGRGSMPLGNVWAYPSASMTYGQTLQAMREVCESAAAIYQDSTLSGHPLDITWNLERDLHSAAQGIAQKRALPQAIPRLATMVAASPFDAALHDAYGKLHQVNVYKTYNLEFVDTNLARFLGSDFGKLDLRDSLLPTAVAQLPLYHLVGAVDPIFPDDVLHPVEDGLPESLVDWIEADGLTHLKIKLNGDHLAWDVHRVLQVHAATQSFGTGQRRTWQYSLDFNEKCQSVEYLLQFMEQLKAAASDAFDRIGYIEQPTARDLASQRTQKIHAASRLKSIVMDESLLDLETLLLAKEMGYTGAALKACKGQTQSLILAAVARHLGMSLCVQDLTCPGASLIHSAGLAANIKGVAAIEANSRQYCPCANRPWEPQFPGVFVIRNGVMRTDGLSGWGLGAYPIVN